MESDHHETTKNPTPEQSDEKKSEHLAGSDEISNHNDEKYKSVDKDDNITQVLQEEKVDDSKNTDKSDDDRSGQGDGNQSNELQDDPDRIIKHIMVIGFHHKHGYQVDYCYPPLEPNGPTFTTIENPITLPDSWKTLPLLCLPDGSHNYDSDTIYFTMPDNDQPSQSNTSELETNHGTKSDVCYDEKISNTSNPKLNTDSGEKLGIKTIFGTACYRQIQADKLLNRTDDMTRVAVQKSVCILSTKPLFGLIRSKLEMITHAYFEELDFSKVGILRLTYDNLNSLLLRDSVKENAIFLGLSARQLISQFGYNTLVLFKAMLLEKKILFYKSPVRDLCSTILSMCSLFTGLLECDGLDHSTCDLQLSGSLLEALKLLPQQPTLETVCCDLQNPPKPPQREERVHFSPSKEQVVIISKPADGPNSTCENSKLDTDHNDDNDESTDSKSGRDSIAAKQLQTDLIRSVNINSSSEILNKSGEYVLINNSGDDINMETDAEDEDDDDDDEGTAASLVDATLADDQQALRLSRVKPEDCGLPLQIFTRGSFCLPYLSITYLDLLSDTRVKSFVIGATNFLFKQKRDMYDIIVDMEENTIIINDVNLKRCLSLTTEDLRFMHNLSKQVKMDQTNTSGMNEFDFISHDITKWVGGDEWIRYHFRLYTLYLLKISRSSSGWELFNNYFVQAWKQTTNNYKIWENSGKARVLDALQCRHPSSGPTKGINFSDMKLKLSYAVNASEKGRIINQTLNGIGKWNIWNNIASAAGAAATSAAATISSASTQISGNVKSSNMTAPIKPSNQVQQQPQQHQIPNNQYENEKETSNIKAPSIEETDDNII